MSRFYINDFKIFSTASYHNATSWRVYKNDSKEELLFETLEDQKYLTSLAADIRNEDGTRYHNDTATYVEIQFILKDGLKSKWYALRKLEAVCRTGNDNRDLITDKKPLVLSILKRDDEIINIVNRCLIRLPLKLAAPVGDHWYRKIKRFIKCKNQYLSDYGYCIDQLDSDTKNDEPVITKLINCRTEFLKNRCKRSLPKPLPYKLHPRCFNSEECEEPVGNGVFAGDDELYLPYLVVKNHAFYAREDIIKNCTLTGLPEIIKAIEIKDNEC